MTVRAEGCPEELLKKLPALASSGTIDEVFLSATAGEEGPGEDEMYVSPGLMDLIRHPGLRGVRRLFLDGDLDPSYLIPLLVDAHWRDSLEVLVMVDSCDAEVMRALARASLPATLVELRMEGWTSGMSDEALCELAEARWLPRLRRLDLGVGGLTDEGMRYLAATEGLALRRLDLQGASNASNTVGADGLSTLAAASWFANLEFLGLAMCGEPGNASVQTALARGASIKCADLSSLGLTEEFIQVASGLPVWRNLEMLSLARNPIGDNGAQLIAQCRRLPATLILHHCDIGPDGLRFLADAVPVKKLDMRFNRLGFADWMRALEEDRLPRTQSLQVDANGWTDHAIQKFKVRCPEFARGRRGPFHG